MGQHLGHDAEHIHMLLEGGFRAIEAAGADGAQHLAPVPDGYANEGHVLVALKSKAARAVQKSRFAAYFAHDDRLGAFHNLACYALSHMIHAPVLLRGGHAHAAINKYVAGFTVQQAYHAPRHAHLAAHVVQQTVQCGHDIVFFRE